MLLNFCLFIKIKYWSWQAMNLNFQINEKTNLIHRFPRMRLVLTPTVKFI